MRFFSRFTPTYLQRGEIATVLTLLSLGLMLAGMAAGSKLVKQEVKTTSLAQSSGCIYNTTDECYAALNNSCYRQDNDCILCETGGVQCIPPAVTIPTETPVPLSCTDTTCINLFGQTANGETVSYLGNQYYAGANCIDANARTEPELETFCGGNTTKVCTNITCKDLYGQTANGETVSHDAVDQYYAGANCIDANARSEPELETFCSNPTAIPTPPPEPTATPATSANACTFDITEVSPSSNDCVVVINRKGTADIAGGGVGCAVSDMSGGKPTGNWQYCSWRGNDVVSGGMKYYFDCTKATTGLQLKAFKFGVCQDVDPHPFVYQPALVDTKPTPATPPQTTAKCTGGNNACLNAVGPHKCCDLCDITENGEWGNSCALDAGGKTTACSDKIQSQGFVLRCFRDDQDGNRWKWIHQYPQCVPNTSCSSAGPAITGTTGTIVPTQPAAGCNDTCARCIWDNFGGGEINAATDNYSDLQNNYRNNNWIAGGRKARPTCKEVNDIIADWCKNSPADCNGMKNDRNFAWQCLPPRSTAECNWLRQNRKNNCYDFCAGAPTVTPGPTSGAVAATLTPNPTLLAGGSRSGGVLIVQGKKLITNRRVTPNPATIDVVLSDSPYSPLNSNKITVDAGNMQAIQGGTFLYPLSGTTIKTLGFLSKEPLPASLKLLDSSGNNLGTFDYNMAFICYPSYTVNSSIPESKLLADCNNKINVIDISAAIGINPTLVPSNTPAPSATKVPTPTPEDQYVFFKPDIIINYPVLAIPTGTAYQTGKNNSQYRVDYTDPENSKAISGYTFKGDKLKGPSTNQAGRFSYMITHLDESVRSQKQATRYVFNPRFAYTVDQKDKTRFKANFTLDLSWCGGPSDKQVPINIYYSDVNSALSGTDHEIVTHLEVNCDSNGSIINTKVNTLSGSSNEVINQAMELWFKKLLNPLEMSAFIYQLTRVSGLQKQNWDICNPNISVCPRTVTVKTNV